jgi:DNA-binding Lrp family transcriptional regulator
VGQTPRANSPLRSEQETKVFTPIERRMRSMRRAFVLANTDMGSEDQIQTELKKLEGIVGVYQVYGVYDVVIEVEAESDQKLKEILFSKIRTLEHVRSTLTLTTTS